MEKQLCCFNMTIPLSTSKINEKMILWDGVCMSHIFSIKNKQHIICTNMHVYIQYIYIDGATIREGEIDKEEIRTNKGNEKIRLSSRAAVSVEDHRCDLCRDKEEKARGRKRDTKGEGGRNEELLLLLSGVLKRGRMCPLQTRLFSWCRGRPNCHSEPPVYECVHMDAMHIHIHTHTNSHHMPVYPLKYTQIFIHVLSRTYCTVCTVQPVQSYTKVHAHTNSHKHNNCKHLTCVQTHPHAMPTHVPYMD